MAQPQEEYYDTGSGWTGWIVFAATMMIIVGGLNAFQGLVALVNDDWIGWNRDTGNAVVLDISQWGWVHLLVGILLVLAGFGVLSGNILARLVGIVIAAISLVTNFFYLPVYTFWALIIILIDIFVIWALTVHGGEMRARR
jgi:hypothetical protein